MASPGMPRLNNSFATARACSSALESSFAGAIAVGAAWACATGTSGPAKYPTNKDKIAARDPRATRLFFASLFMISSGYLCSFIENLIMPQILKVARKKRAAKKTA
jgi:hypothetical protein